MTRCAWCRDPDTEYEPIDPEHELCHSHLCEYDGLSEDGYDHMVAEQAADRM